MFEIISFQVYKKNQHVSALSHTTSTLYVPQNIVTDIECTTSATLLVLHPASMEMVRKVIHAAMMMYIVFVFIRIKSCRPIPDCEDWPTEVS